MKTDAGKTPTRREQLIPLPSPAPGTTRGLSVVHYGRADARPYVYLQAALHADELPGAVVLHHLQHFLDKADARGAIWGRVTLVPLANPLGLSQSVQGTLSGRLDLDGGKNFNRHYPNLAPMVVEEVDGQLSHDATNNTHIIRNALDKACRQLASFNDSERLRHELMTLAVGSDICLDLHCDAEALLHVFTGTPLWPRAKTLAAHVGAHGIFLAKESGGFPFDEAIAGPWWAVADAYPDYPVVPACLSATIEYRGIADVDDAMARDDALKLYQYLVAEGVVDDCAPPPPRLRCDPTPLEGVHYLRAPTAGILLHHAQPGDRLSRGDKVATILNPLARGDGARTELISETDGLVFARSAQRFARPGAVVASIAGATAIVRPSGVGLLTD